MPRRNSHLFPAVVLATALSACGGSSGSGTLDYQLDQMYLAQIPLSGKQTVLQAQNDYAAAKMEHNTAESELRESATDIKIAKNERSQIKLDQQSAESRKEAADKSGDLTRINSAAMALRAAKLASQAAAKKVEYEEARRAYLKQKLVHAENDMFAKEARYELSKARLAKSNNIRPRGFSLANYETQSQERSRIAQESANVLQKRQTVTTRLHKEWQSLLGEAKRLGARDSTNKNPKQ